MPHGGGTSAHGQRSVPPSRGERDAWPTVPRDGPQWVIPGVVGERVTRPRVGRTPLRRRLRLDGRGRFSIPPKLPCGMEPPYFEPARVAVLLAPEIGRGRPPVPFSVRGAHDTHCDAFPTAGAWPRHRFRLTRRQISHRQISLRTGKFSINFSPLIRRHTHPRHAHSREIFLPWPRGRAPAQAASHSRAIASCCSMLH